MSRFEIIFCRMIWLYFSLTICLTVAQLTNDTESLLNWCLDAKYHKSKPGPEDELHKQCTPWKERSCCTSNTTRHMQHSSLYKFNYNHCSQYKNISESCYRHFIQDLCFYECSPNVGPWVVQVSMKIRNERFFEVPLCASDCDAWFNACKDDYTCTEKWTNPIMSEGRLTPCHDQSDCKTFSEIYKSSKNFCEKVWDHSWKYTEDTEPCMRIWFDGSEGNPNDRVTKYYVDKILRSSATSATSLIWFIVSTSTAVVINHSLRV